MIAYVDCRYSGSLDYIYISNSLEFASQIYSAGLNCIVIWNRILSAKCSETCTVVKTMCLKRDILSYLDKKNGPSNDI